MKNPNLKALLIVVMWAVIFNIVYEFFLIFVIYTPFSRIGASIDAITDWKQRNYTNTTSISPDELVGTWIMEFAQFYDRGEDAYKTKLILNNDQTFDLYIMPHVFYISTYRSSGAAPNIPEEYRNENYQWAYLHLRGTWGTVVHDLNEYNYTEKKERFSTHLVGRYEKEDDYVFLGEILDRHVSDPQKRFALKWTWKTRELGNNLGAYLVKSDSSSKK